jgi:hypothetical protein
MRSLIWKECHENLKWVVLPALLILGPLALMNVTSVLDTSYLGYVSLVAPLFGAVLGFLQVFPEARGDKRALLLHRPLSRSQIFLGKAAAGVGLYLLAVAIPFVGMVALAATPGHVDEPFRWPMVLPLLADCLAGLVGYFAGMLTGQREGRWYGSRCLGLGACVFCWFVVWTVSGFWQALVAIAVLTALTAVAAWGSFLTGGVYASGPRLSRLALAGTFLSGLLGVGFLAKFALGAELNAKSDYWYVLDRQGNVLRVHYKDGLLQSVTDLRGQTPAELAGKRLDKFELDRVTVAAARGGTPRTVSYRNKNRCMVEYDNPTRPGNEKWWYVPDQGRLLGYDKHVHRFIGSVGPDGFARPDEQLSGRFEGELAHMTHFYYSKAGPYLAFPGAVYAVDFRAKAVRKIFTPAEGEKVLWANPWQDEAQKQALVFVGTDRSFHVLDEEGTQLLAAPRAYDLRTYRITRAGRLANPPRYWVWYEPAWFLALETLETMPAYVVEYDSARREASRRQEAPCPASIHNVTMPLPIVEPSQALAWFGPVTSPAEAAFFTATRRHLESEVRDSGGTQTPLLLQFLLVTTQYFVPGVRWDWRAHAGLVYTYGALMLLSAVTCAAACFVLGRRFALSRRGCLGWSLGGLLFGLAGLLLLLALHEWPARVACPKCHRPRVVARDHCEHCGAAHAAPAPDGTEIFEEVAAAPHEALAGR